MENAQTQTLKPRVSPADWTAVYLYMLLQDSFLTPSLIHFNSGHSPQSSANARPCRIGPPKPSPSKSKSVGEAGAVITFYQKSRQLLLHGKGQK
ncbi:hypothetical protein AVEN_185350-1 [Araneus ventricosus]|uniref:Uncharacterized protein n=1 Tax=Araneus ventricosus TaxID=182803 RepID=A0A4Y2HRT3_ARAVE|nr:hypothetical protein AVEN_185350-1 [Araneus ventricosus]